MPAAGAATARIWLAGRNRGDRLDRAGRSRGRLVPALLGTQGPAKATSARATTKPAPSAMTLIAANKPHARCVGLVARAGGAIATRFLRVAAGTFCSSAAASSTTL